MACCHRLAVLGVCCLILFVWFGVVVSEFVCGVWISVGDITCMATIPEDMEVEAYFLAKEDGIIAGIALAEMIFHEVDPTLKVKFLALIFVSMHSAF